MASISYMGLFAHQWFIGTELKVDTDKIRIKLDQKLMELNDDYRVERSATLKEIFVEVLPSKVFYQWMKLHGKEGGQNKFPRVLKKGKFVDWKQYVEQEGYLQ